MEIRIMEVLLYSNKYYNINIVMILVGIFWSCDSWKALQIEGDIVSMIINCVESTVMIKHLPEMLD